MGDPLNFPDSVARRCQGLSRTGHHPQLRQNIWQEPENQGSSRLSCRVGQDTGPSLVPVGQLNGRSLRFRTTPLVLSHNREAGIVPVIVPTLPGPFPLSVHSIPSLCHSSLPLAGCSSVENSSSWRNPVSFGKSPAGPRATCSCSTTSWLSPRRKGRALSCRRQAREQPQGSIQNQVSAFPPWPERQVSGALLKLIGPDDSPVSPQ